MLKEDIELAKKVIADSVDKRYLSNYFLRLYPFTNENLSSYMKILKYNGKSVLTTGSSCDQILNLINYGCEDISLFDINPFVKYYFELKKAAIKSLDREDYMNFLHSHTPILNFKSKTFNPRTFDKVDKNMSEDARKFWHTLISEYTASEVRKMFFMGCELSKSNIILNNDYLSEENYINLKGKLDDIQIKFYKDDLCNLKNNYDKYDCIILSNIFDYIFNLQVKSIDEIFDIMPNYKNLLDGIKDMLKDEGIVFFHYVWDYNFDSDYHLMFYNFFKKDGNNSEIYIPSNSHTSNIKDGVFAYKKRVKKID